MSVTTTRNDNVWEFKLDPTDSTCKCFINDYFLYAQHAWFMLAMHVGEIGIDQSKPIKITISVENVEKRHEEVLA